MNSTDRPWLLLALAGWLCATPFLWAGLLIGKSAMGATLPLALFGPWILSLPAIVWFYKASRLRSAPFSGRPLAVGMVAAVASFPLVVFINMPWGYAFVLPFGSQLLPITACNSAIAVYAFERRRAGIAEPLVSRRAKAALFATFWLLVLGDVLKFTAPRSWTRLQSYSARGADTTPSRYRRLDRLRKGEIEFQQTGEETPATFACVSQGALVLVEGPGAGCASLWLERIPLDETGGADWSRCLDVPSRSLPRGMACAPDGTTYLAGTDPHQSGDAVNRWWLRALGPDGGADERWRARFEKRAYFFRPNSVALGPNALYVAGEDGGVGWDDERHAWIRKFDLGGREDLEGWPKSLVWDAGSSTVEPSASGPPGRGHNGLRAKKVAVAPSGEIVATLEHEVDATVLVRYGPDGSRLPFPLPPPWRGSVVDLAVDGKGSIVLAGHADSLCPGEAGRRTAIVAKLEADGTVLWTTALGCSRPHDSSLRAIALDGASIYAGGSTRDLVFEESGEDWWIDRIASSGAQDPAFAVQAGHRSDDRVTRLLVSDGRLLALGRGGGYGFSRSIWDYRLR